MKKEYIGRRISHELEEIMEQRRTVNTDTDNVKTITIIDGQDVSDMGQIIFPIICEGDVIGSVVLMSKTENSRLVTRKKACIGGCRFSWKTNGILI